MFRVTSPQPRPDKAECVIFALWAVCEVMPSHSLFETKTHLFVHGETSTRTSKKKESKIARVTFILFLITNVVW